MECGRIANINILFPIMQLYLITEKALFKIVGMYCISCKPIVERQLKEEKAVKNISFDYLTDSIIVEFDPLVLTIGEIKNKLDKSGYRFVRLAKRGF